VAVLNAQRFLANHGQPWQGVVRGRSSGLATRFRAVEFREWRARFGDSQLGDATLGEPWET